MFSIKQDLVMNIRRITIVSFFYTLMSSAAFAGWFDPSNFSECAEKYVKRAKSNRAALILNYTCRMQFDQNKQSSDWKSYYDCVRNNLEDVEQDNAASLLVRSCQERYRQLFYLDQNGFYKPIE
jgi:hypothetical protein